MISLKRKYHCIIYSENNSYSYKDIHTENKPQLSAIWQITSKIDSIKGVSD